jgi:protein subunit release factor A
MKKKHLFSVTKKDLKIEYFRASGKGGQNRNKRDTACRITHIESGAVGVGKDQRSQEQNKVDAFTRMANSHKFKMWHAQKVKELTDKETVEDKVNKQMSPANLKVEVQDDEGKWIDE